VVLALPGRLLLLSFKHRELGRRQGAETAMWPPMIVVVAPCVDGLACFSQREEHVLVEALIAKFAVERFDEGILHRLAGFDVVPL
jgi:hypothetical protein